jgi:TRAP-type mannitol/chloroaromatic compound transport system substrate-binding protein
MSKREKSTQTDHSRRKFLGAAAVAGVGVTALAAPNVARAQDPITMKWQSTWPAKDIFHEYALDFASKVNSMSGGRLKIDVLPSGAVVKAFDLLDAVSSGTLDGGHGVIAYWYGKNSALALWGSGPAFGMDPNMLLSWHNYGGGRELQQEIYASLNMNVVSLLYGPMPTQPLGWFKKPVAKVDDLKGLKFRTVGLSIDIFTALGAAVNALPGARSCRRWIAACSMPRNSTMPRRTRCLASPMSPRSACCRASTNAPNSSRSCSTRPNTTPCRRIFDRSSPRRLRPRRPTCRGRRSIGIRRIHEALKADGVKFYKTPDAILQAQLDAWSKIIEKIGRESDVQESARIAARLCRAHRAVAERYAPSTSAWPTTTSLKRAEAEQVASAGDRRFGRAPVFYPGTRP